MPILQQGNVYALPVIHYNMETALIARQQFLELNPSCVALELPETMQLPLLHGASRLPSLSIASRQTYTGDSLYWMIEPCDALFESMRSALENNVDAFCIDLDLDDYPMERDYLPDPYAIRKIGLKSYYKLYVQSMEGHQVDEKDRKREWHMAKRLKELSLRYDRVLFVGGMYHMERVMQLLNQESFPLYQSVERELMPLYAPSDKSVREIMNESGYLTRLYEEARADLHGSPPDRQQALLKLYKEAAEAYKIERSALFPGYNLRNTMKFARNYALQTSKLLPDLFQTIAAAKGCVDHHYAYEVWKLATEAPFHKNTDGLPEIDISPEELYGSSKKIHFLLKPQARKAFQQFAKRRDKTQAKLYPPSPFSICSYPPEDVIIENFGDFLKKKGVSLMSEEGARTIPFSTSLEDGIDTRETIRHFGEKKLYVRTKGRPPGTVGSVVVIFDEDHEPDKSAKPEKFPWMTTWIGEHSQESDMAFYATSMKDNLVGPGIAKCTYGGFLLSYPPRRLYDVWSDPDYAECRTKAEVLLMAAIDYAEKPLIVYVAAKPPRTQLKSFAKRYGKKLLYIPIGQLSKTTLDKLRTFHVLDGHDKRTIADEFID